MHTKAIRAFPLARLHAGIIFTQSIIILMVFGSSLFAVQVGILRFGLDTTFGLPWPSAGIIAQSLELAFYFGWFMMVLPIRPAQESRSSRWTRRLLRVSLMILTSAGVFGYVRIFGELQPWLASIDFGVQMLTVVPTLALYPLQMLSIRHAADALGDTKTRDQTRVWIWLSPVLIAAAASLVVVVHAAFMILLGIVLLVVVTQYWNALNRLRKRIRELLARTSVAVPIAIRD